MSSFKDRLVVVKYVVLYEKVVQSVLCLFQEFFEGRGKKERSRICVGGGWFWISGVGNGLLMIGTCHQQRWEKVEGDRVEKRITCLLR